MSADNRIIIHYQNDKYYVWEGSCSTDYFEAPESAKSFEFKDDAERYAHAEADECYVLEGGVQWLTQNEIISGLRQELEMYKNPAYCPECGACGEDPCCSGSMCTHNKCMYGDNYVRDYEYNRELVKELYGYMHYANDDLRKIAEELLTKCHDKIYNKKEENDTQIPSMG